MVGKEILLKLVTLVLEQVSIILNYDKKTNKLPRLNKVKFTDEKVVLVENNRILTNMLNNTTTETEKFRQEINIHILNKIYEE